MNDDNRNTACVTLDRYDAMLVRNCYAQHEIEDLSSRNQEQKNELARMEVKIQRLERELNAANQNLKFCTDRNRDLSFNLNSLDTKLKECATVIKEVKVCFEHGTITDDDARHLIELLEGVGV